MIIYVDIDETICYHEEDDTSKARDYTKAKPYVERINKVNSLYDDGHTIVYWTARGTNINDQDFTSIRQIAEQEESFRPGAVTFLEGETIEGQLNLTGDENKASIFLDVKNDLKSEKDETVNVEFFSSLSDKLTNQPIANTSFVIRDTSKGIPSIADQYFIDAPAYVNEGETYILRLTPDGLPEFDNPQQLYASAVAYAQQTLSSQMVD